MGRTRCHTLPSNDDFGFEVFLRGRASGTADNNSHYRAGTSDHWSKHLPAAALFYVKLHYCKLIRYYFPHSGEQSCATCNGNSPYCKQAFANAAEQS
jgi:hypothetical protein